MQVKNIKIIGKLQAGCLLLCLFCNNTSVLAQKRERKAKTDTLYALREFISLSNGYKQVPLNLELELKNSTNFVTNTDDTLTVQAVFCLGKENSYVRFGEFEQVVNDSMALLVSDKLQQMILYNNAAGIVSKARSMMGLPVQDSSLRRMADRYTSSIQPSPGGESEITLQSRMKLYGTSLPKETIIMQYDRERKLLQQVTTIKRTLMLLDASQFNRLQEEKEEDSNLLTLEGQHFLVKEQTAAFIYRKIEHPVMAKIPVLMTDRIIRTEDGYKPVPKYETYMLTSN